MCLIRRPESLSDNAWFVMQAVYENYSTNDSKEFENFKQFDFSKEELFNACEELHNARFVFFENRNTDSAYLYMLATILPYTND